MSAEFMRRAITLALENIRNGGGPFGAVVVKDGNVVAEGANRVTVNHDPTAHAEVVAIRAACAALGSFELKGCELYASCEPCPMCLGAAYWARLSRVYFAGTAEDAAAAGFDDAVIYREMALPHEHRQVVMSGLLREDGKRVFRAWAAAPNKTTY
jgi:guanine deaminase